MLANEILTFLSLLDFGLIKQESSSLNTFAFFLFLVLNCNFPNVNFCDNFLKIKGMGMRFFLFSFISFVHYNCMSVSLFVYVFVLLLYLCMYLFFCCISVIFVFLLHFGEN